MASVDLKDAFYSIPIHQQFQKYIKFMGRENVQFSWYTKRLFRGYVHFYKNAQTTFFKFKKLRSSQ